MKTHLLLALCGCASPCMAQTVDALQPRVPPAKVEQLVIEDDAVRIEELRVRGHTQRIVVTSRSDARWRYEIVTGEAARDLSTLTSSSRGAAGQRVWNVLNF